MAQHRRRFSPQFKAEAMRFVIESDRQIEVLGNYCTSVFVDGLRGLAPSEALLTLLAQWRQQQRGRQRQCQLAAAGR